MPVVPNQEVRKLDEGVSQKGSSEISGEQERIHYEEEEGPWYMGKAKEEFHRRRTGQPEGRRGEEEDPIQV